MRRGVDDAARGKARLRGTCGELAERARSQALVQDEARATRLCSHLSLSAAGTTVMRSVCGRRFSMRLCR